MHTAIRISHRLLIAGAMLALLPNCPAKRTADLELAAAQAALDDALASRGADCATEIYRAAESALDEARWLASEDKHADARAKATEAETLANQARAASPPGCDGAEDPTAGRGGANPARGNVPQTTAAGRDLALSDVLRTVYFDYNRAHIREDSKTVLGRVSQVLSGAPSTRLEIEGHCDVRGSTEYNLHLGERRARAVKKYLVTQGVRPDQILTISYGEERPIDYGQGEDAHQRNRRAELRSR